MAFQIHVLEMFKICFKAKFGVVNLIEKKKPCMNLTDIFFLILL